VSPVWWLLVALGTGLGALARYVVDQWVQHGRAKRGQPLQFPAGILLINVTGSLLLGFLTGVASHGLGPYVLAFAATGLCGGYTTFSTWAYDTVRLAADGKRTLAIANVGLSVAGGMAAAGVGLGLALL
jgi:fluoride exporter